MEKDPVMQREPVVIIQLTVTLVQAVIGLFILFGLEWTEEQVAGVMAVVVIVGQIVAALWARSKVYSPSTVKKLAPR